MNYPFLDELSFVPTQVEMFEEVKTDVDKLPTKEGSLTAVFTVHNGWRYVDLPNDPDSFKSWVKQQLDKPRWIVQRLRGDLRVFTLH